MRADDALIPIYEPSGPQPARELAFTTLTVFG
jgi:hypothetical protein